MRFQVALFTVIKILYNTTYRMVYPFLGIFAAGMGMDLAGFAVVFTARSLTGMLGPFLAPIADRRGRKTSMLLGLGVFILGAGLAALWPSFPTFLAALALTTLGNYIFLPAVQAYLGDRVPYARRGLVLAITETSWSLAFIVGVPLIGFLLAASGWASPFGLLAILGCVAFIVLALTLPATPATGKAGDALWHSLGRVLTSRPALAALLMSFALTTANESINLVFGVWIENSFHLQLAALGAASAVIGVAELSGEGLTGALVDRLGKQRAIRIGIAACALSALALPFVSGSLVGALAGLFFFYLSFEFTIVSELPLVSEILPEARATLLATNIAAFSMGRAAGSLLAPWLFGLGFAANTAASLAFYLLAFFALGLIRLEKEAIGGVAAS